MKTSIQILFLSFIFITSSCKKDKVNPPVVADIDGNIYDTIKIGTQVWMKENLKTTHYNDGTVIPTGLNDADWYTSTSDAFAIYDNSASNDTVYGKLYNWYAVNTGKLAPKGWHVPSNAEWTTLHDYLSNAGEKLKTTDLWSPSPGVVNTNSTGFSALPGGLRNVVGSFVAKGFEGHFWSSSVSIEATALDLSYADSHIVLAIDVYDKRYGFSVRCIKD